MIRPQMHSEFAAQHQTKGRKGKEGRERKGKDRKGKERKGRERKQVTTSNVTPFSEKYPTITSKTMYRLAIPRFGYTARALKKAIHNTIAKKLDTCAILCRCF